ncbi:MAG: ubiquinol-cytochrome c reductase iron-sulfur subunit [Phycisphaerae bacterium]
MDGPSRVSRREVLVNVAGIGAALAAAGCACGALGGCELQREKPKVTTTGRVNIGPEANYPAGTANTSQYAKCGIVVTNDSGVPLAIRPKCTHMGCNAKWDEKDFRFECPCHGSEFDLLGRAIKGPATKPLPSVVAEKQPDGTLVVDLDKLYAQ